MRTKTGILRRLAVLVALALSVGVAARADEAGRLPADWFVLPEDAPRFYGSDAAKRVEVRDGVTYTRSEQAASESLDKIFYYTAQSLQSSGRLLGKPDRPEDAPLNWVPWHLREIYMDLGVNAAGTAGLVTGIGEASVEVRWSQTRSALREQGLTAVEPSGESEGEADLRMTDATTPLEMERMVDQVTEAVMATGRVQDRPRMREGLLRVATDLQEVMVNINAYNDSYWDINKFGLDIEVSGSGKVSAGWTLGGAVRLRFEWKRTNYGMPLPEPTYGEDKREELRRLLATVAKDMDQVGQDLYAGSGYDLTTLRLGIGLYFSAKFGIVKGKLGVTGYAFFEKKRYRANASYGNYYASRPRIVPTVIPLIDDEPAPEHLTYASQAGVSYDKVPGGDGAADRVVYYMNRERFQQGLKRATQMGAWFAQRAKRHNGEGSTYSRWAATQVKPSFALSMEGAAKVVTLGGKVSLELTFKRL